MSLSMLWGAINGLQVVAYLMLFNVATPANVLIVVKLLYEVVTFDLVPLDWLTDYHDEVVGEEDRDHEVYMSAQAREGFERTNPITNLALPIVSIVVAYAVLALVKLASLCSTRVARTTRLCNIRAISKCSAKTSRLSTSIRDSLCWNYPFRLLNEEYITISLACMIKANALDYSTVYESVSSSFALLLLALTLLTPFIVTRWLWRIHSKCTDCLEDETFQKRWGTWTLDLRTTDRMALLFTLVFMARRSILAFIIIGLPRWSWLQIQVILNLNTFAMIYQGWFMPYTLPTFNRKELINEFLIQMCTYYLFVYTDFVPDAETRYKTGWAHIGCLGLMVVFNHFLLFKWQI